MTPEDKQQHYERAKVLLAEQNFRAAVLFGSIAAVLAATAYAMIAVAAGYTVAYTALGVGAVVGFAVQFLGRGVESRYVMLASILAVAACILGNVIAMLLLRARFSGESASDIASGLSPELLLDLAAKGIRPVDLVFWMLAVGAASYFAKRRLSREDGLAIYTYERRPKGFGPGM